MSKISKQLFSDYNATKKKLKKAKSKHSENVNKIVEIIKPLLPYTKFKNVSITKIEFCNDQYMKDKPEKFEWVEISEEEYDKLYKEERYNYYNSSRKQESKLKEDYGSEPDWKITYYKLIPVKYKYLRVTVEETWAYGGYDCLYYDFLLSDIMDETYLRKEKLEKLEKL